MEGAAGGFATAGEQPQQRGFSSAIVADETEYLAAAESEGDIIQYWGALVVEADIVGGELSGAGLTTL